MRTVHISDLHLSQTNLDSFKKFYFEALIKDLIKHDKKEKIELIFLTGDLVDKGGKSLGADCYEIVEKHFIIPILTILNLTRDRIILLPGNHDVDTSKIKKVEENGLIAINNITDLNSFVTENKENWHEGIERIKPFKTFEKLFYKDIKECYISNFESCFIVETNDHLRIGVAALNSAWRCSSSLPENKLLLGTIQILDAKEYLRLKKTNLNILLVHHPLDLFADFEKGEIKNFISNFDFHVVLCGHTHNANQGSSIGVDGNLFFSVAKSAFNDPRENYDKYKPGYSIMDYNIDEKGKISIETYFRKYIHTRVSFDKDVDASEDGYYKIGLPAKISLPANFITKDIVTGVKEPIINVWNKVTEVLIDSAFPMIGEKMAGLIKNYMFPRKIDHYNKNVEVSYDVKRKDQNHFSLDELQDFTIISDGTPIVLDTYYFIEKNNNKNDLSDIEIAVFDIDGVPFDKNKIMLKEKVSKNILRKSVSLITTLSGKTEYKISRLIKSVHSLSLNGIWKYNITLITENLSLHVRNSDNFELDIIKFGNSAGNFIESSPFLDTKKNKYESLLMPGEGFILVVKNKEKQLK